MPDDIEEEVTEQEEEPQTPEEEEEDFDGAFSEDEKEESEEDETKEEETEEEEAVYPGAKEEEAEEEEDLDDDEKRGQELLDKGKEAQDEVDKAAVDKAAKEKEEVQEDETTQMVSNEDIDLYSGLIDPETLPEYIKVGDEEIDLKSYIQDSPEAAIIAGITAKEILARLIDNGVIVTGQQYQEGMGSVRQEALDREFLRVVTTAVPNAVKIDSSKKFISWKKEAPDNIKALFQSDDPSDYARGLKRFLAQATKTTKKKVAVIDQKAKKEKKEHDDLHSSTIKSRSTRRKGTKTAISESDDFDDGFDEAGESA